MLFRCILIVLTFIAFAQSQIAVENNHPVCLNPWLPSPDQVENYFKQLQTSQPRLYKQLTSPVKSFYKVGEERTFNVLNLVDRDKVEFDAVTATLMASNEGINIWVANEELENEHVTTGVIDEMLSGLTESTPFGSISPQEGIVEIEHRVFGPPPDVDNNSTVEFLLTDIKDGWDQNGGFIGGFFYSLDQNVSANGSNAADLMYIDTFPGIYRENDGSVTRDVFSALSTLAHEYQHLIQYNNDREEVAFVNEGLSEIASFICGYGLRNPSHYLQNTNISLIDFEGSDFNISLNHYAKVALWTYYLYEQFGLDYVTSLSLNENQGVTGIDAALAQEGIDGNFNELALSFFKTLASNDPEIFPEYAFLDSDLNYLRAQPTLRLTDAPASGAIQVKPYALGLVQITNVDSLEVALEGAFFGESRSNRAGLSGQYYLEEISFPYVDPFFGTDDHTLTLIFLNNTNSGSNLVLDIDGNPKAYLQTLYDGDEEPDFLIFSENNINAAGFDVQYDSTILKSVAFYNGSNGGVIRVHVYNESIDQKSRPSSETVVLENALSFDWVTVDVENLAVMRDAGQVFEIGIEYLDQGSMGYSDENPVVSQSYLKTGVSIFRPLDQYQLSGGQSLDGVWMIRAEMGAPARFKPSDADGSKLEWTVTNPVWYLPGEHDALVIGYNNSDEGNVVFEVFDILGKVIYRRKNTRQAGFFYWDGQTSNDVPAASGFYFLQLRSRSDKIAQKLLLVR